MINPLRTLVVAAMCFAAGGSGVTAQQKPAAAAEAQQKPAAAEKERPFGLQPAGPMTPLKVQIVMSRYRGEKRVSALPYEITVLANDGPLGPNGEYHARNGPARLRVGAEVPVTNIAVPSDASGGKPNIAGPISYRDISTQIDCTAHSIEDGRYKVLIAIKDTSVYADDQTADGLVKYGNAPSFRSFQSNNTVILRLGQTTQFTAAADRITGEVTRVDVTLVDGESKK